MGAPDVRLLQRMNEPIVEENQQFSVKLSVSNRSSQDN